VDRWSVAVGACWSGSGCSTGSTARDPLPEAYCDLAPDYARKLAFDLLAAAEHAEQQSREAGFWKGEQRARGWSADA
jgi:hypothetical protein